MNVKIEKLVYGGDGLTHADNATIFVPFVLPGEEVEIDPAQRKKKFIRGRVVRVLSPSAERIAASCPYFQKCGGCHYQHMPYAAQLRYKESILRETLRRIGKIEWNEPIVVHGSPEWNYRNRAQWKVRILDDHEAPQIGYFRAESMELVPVETCPIVSPRLLATLTTLRAMLADGSLPDSAREIEAFADDADDAVTLTLTFAKFPREARAVYDALRERIPQLASALIQDGNEERMELFGGGSLQYRVGDFQHRVSHFSFFQVNRFLAGEMASAVVDAAGSGKLAVDLFAGVGLFSLPLGRQFARVIGVEANPVAVRDFQANVALPENAGGRKIECRETDSVEFLRRFRETPDCVVLDPPRAGLEMEGAERLLKLGASRIVYMSCDPATLARDLAVLVGGGYRISVVHLFDLFPQTFHIESMVRLERRE